MATLRMHEFELIHKTGSKKIHKLDTRLSPKYKEWLKRTNGVYVTVLLWLMAYTSDI